MPNPRRQRLHPRLRAIGVLLALVLGASATAGCGGGQDAALPAPRLGTLSFANETDQGSLAFTVVQLFVQQRGVPAAPVNLLAEPVAPGGLVIVGQFPEGLYDVLAVVESNLSVPFNDVALVANQPTTIRLQFD